MSTVRGATTITFTPLGDSINTSLRSNRPLEQLIRAGTSTITPDWTVEVNRPTIYPVIRSSLTNLRIGGNDISNDVWRYNGAEITFKADGFSNAVAGTEADTFFREVRSMGGSIAVPTLTICKNLASPTNNNADVIEFSARVITGGLPSNVAASTDIRIEEVEGDPYTGFISASNGGTIDSNTPSVTLTAMLFRGGNLTTENVTYRWHKSDGVNWNTLNTTPTTSNTLEVTAADINTQEIFRCEFIIGGNTVANAMQSVFDETDPLVLVLNPNAPETLSETQRVIEYRPRVIKRGDTTLTPIPGYRYSFMITDSTHQQRPNADGLEWSGTNIAQNAHISVKLEHAKTAGGGLTLIIDAVPI